MDRSKTGPSISSKSTTGRCATVNGSTKSVNPNSFIHTLHPFPPIARSLNTSTLSLLVNVFIFILVENFSLFNLVVINIFNIYSNVFFLLKMEIFLHFETSFIFSIFMCTFSFIFAIILEIKFIYNFSSSFENIVKFVWLLLIWFYLSEKCTFHRAIFRSFSPFPFLFFSYPSHWASEFSTLHRAPIARARCYFQAWGWFCQTAQSKFIPVFGNPTNFRLPAKFVSNLEIILNFRHSKIWKFPWKPQNSRDCSWNVDILDFQVTTKNEALPVHFGTFAVRFVDACQGWSHSVDQSKYRWNFEWAHFLL